MCFLSTSFFSRGFASMNGTPSLLSTVPSESLSCFSSTAGWGGRCCYYSVDEQQGGNLTRIEKEDQYLVYCNLFRAKSGMMACEIACEPEFTKWRAACLILMMSASRRVISRTATVPLQSPSLLIQGSQLFSHPPIVLHAPGGPAHHFQPVHTRDNVQAHIDARRDSCRGDNISLIHYTPIREYLNRRIG